MEFEEREMKYEVKLSDQPVGFTFWNGLHVYMKTDDASNSNYPNGVVCLTGEGSGGVDCYPDCLPPVHPALVKIVGDPK